MPSSARLPPHYTKLYLCTQTHKLCTCVLTRQILSNVASSLHSRTRQTWLPALRARIEHADQNHLVQCALKLHVHPSAPYFASNGQAQLARRLSWLSFGRKRRSFCSPVTLPVHLKDSKSLEVNLTISQTVVQTPSPLLFPRHRNKHAQAAKLAHSGT